MANFAATFSQQAGLLLSKPLTVRPALAARRSAGEFLASVEATSCCYALHPLSNGDSEHSVHQPAGWVEIAPGVALAMIDLLLGGLQAGQQIPSRPLTEIERRLLLRVVQVAAAAMMQTWPTMVPPLTAQETPLAAACDPGRATAVVAFELSVQDQVGALRLCVPGPECPASTSSTATNSTESRKQAPLLISIATPEVDVSADDLAKLAPGDIVTTEADANGEVIVRVAGIPKFAARLGSCSGRRAITITRKLNGSDGR